MDGLDLTAAESKAICTYGEIRNYMLEHMGLKASNLCIAQIKQKCVNIKKSKLNLPESESNRQPKCPPEREAAVTDTFKHFHIIP